MRRHPPPDRDALAYLWKRESVEHICTVLGIHRRCLDYYVQRYGLDPTPEEIREYTLSLQATWSDEERDRRAGRSRLGVAVRSLGYDGRNMAFSDRSL